MSEIPMPTMPLAQAFSSAFSSAFNNTFRKPLPRKALSPWPLLGRSKIPRPRPHIAPAPLQEGLAVSWARHQSEVREAQALRYSVFAGEMGAKIKTSLWHPKLDIDRFDDFCEHLIVRDLKTQQVVGTYRLLTPVQAKRMGCFYTDTEFDMSPMHQGRDNMVELGRSCVHPDFRHGGVIMSLGRELFQFMARNKFEAMFGCASIPLYLGADEAASICAKVIKDYSSDLAKSVTPLNPFPLHDLAVTKAVELPAMLKGYLRLGAKVLGAPAWDPDFNTVDLPIMARMADLSPRYKKHFEISV